MNSRLLKLFLALTILLTAFTSVCVLAANKLVEADLMRNGDMEMLGTVSAYWTGVTIEENIVHSGKQSLKLFSEDPDKQKVSTNAEIKGFSEDVLYTVSVWCYAEKVNPTSVFKLSVAAKDESGASLQSDSSPAEIPLSKTGKWIKVSATFAAPADAYNAIVYMRLIGGGTSYLDDASFVGMVTPENKEKIDAEKKLDADLFTEGEWYMQKERDKELAREFIDGAENILPNSGFEETSNYGDSTIPRSNSWISSSWGTYGEVVTDPADVRSGSKAAKIIIDSAAKKYMAQYLNTGFEAGQEYMMSAWVKMKDVRPHYGVDIKFESYSDKSKRNYTTQIEILRSTVYVIPKDNDWHEIKFSYKVPDNTKMLCIFITLEGSGEMIIDDAKLAKVKPANLIELDSYRTFFYSDTEESSIFATLDNSNAGIEPGSYVEFSLKDENGTVVATDKVPARKETFWNFKTALMTEKQKPYTASASYCDACYS